MSKNKNEIVNKKRTLEKNFQKGDQVLRSYQNMKKNIEFVKLQKEWLQSKKLKDEEKESEEKSKKANMMSD